MTFLLAILATGFALALFPKVLLAIISLLPDSQGLPTGVQTALEFAVSKINSFSFIFPVDTLVQIIQYVVLLEVGVLALKLGLLIIKIIRGSAS